MKKLRQWGASLFRNDKRLLAFCYAVFLAGSLLWPLFGYVEDRVQRARGNVTPMEVSMSDFELTDLEQTGPDSYVSISVDPRMVMKDPPKTVRTVTVRFNFTNMEPGEFCLFYKPREGMEDFDARCRVWAHVEDDGSYTFTLPYGDIYGLRIDPGIYYGLRFDVESITFNEPRSFLSWFTPTRTWALSFLVVPALSAAILKYAAALALRLHSAARREGGK